MKYTIPYETIATPYYLCNLDLLEKNINVFAYLQQKTGCRLLFALKAFAMFQVFPYLQRVFNGTAVSSLHEAQLGYEKFGKEIHLYSPAYKDTEMPLLARYADYIVFNSFAQWKKYRHWQQVAEKSCGIRINPEYSSVSNPYYNPCIPQSHLGVVHNQFHWQDIAGLQGIHFHTLCESSADDLEATIMVVEKSFGNIFHQLKWINIGGGHHLTSSDYNIEKLCRTIIRLQNRYHLNVYLEPGESIVLNSGVLVATVLDIIHNQTDIAILDTSAATHMPAILEVPYQPMILGASSGSRHKYRYRLAGISCMAGDIIGDYSFPAPLQCGDKIIFLDMLHYTMVKNTTFNGIALPSIATWSKKEGLRVVRTFGYQDYLSRLS